MHRLLIGIVVSGGFAGLGACTQSNPLYCGDEAPCPTGQSCSIQHVCQAGFTLDEGVFHFDGSKYWVATSTPTFSGSSDAPNATIHVMVGEQEFGPAEFSGESWKLTLPPNIIKDSEDANIRFLQSVGNKQVEIARLVALDDKAPTAKIESTQVLDESKDVVTFDEDGTPVHDHQAYPVVINDVQEAVINKYAHLLHVGHPHAKELAPNPLLIKVAIKANVALSENGANFRIVDAGGAVVADWQSGQVTKVDGGFVAAAEITRANVPNLKLSGRYCLQWNVSDWAHRAAEAQTCMKLTLLAPPLHAVGPRLPTAAPESIGNWKLATGAPFNTMTGDPKAQIYEGVFTNNTPEPVTFEVHTDGLSQIRMTRSTKTIDTVLARWSGTDINIFIEPCFGGGCENANPQAPVSNMVKDFTTTFWFAALDHNNQPSAYCNNSDRAITTFSCTLPAAMNEPASVRIVARVAGLRRGPDWTAQGAARDAGIFPPIPPTHFYHESRLVIDERTYNTQPYYGTDIEFEGCVVLGSEYRCVEATRIRRVQMLTSAKISVTVPGVHPATGQPTAFVPGFDWRSAVPGDPLTPAGQMGRGLAVFGGVKWDGGTLP